MHGTPRFLGQRLARRLFLLFVLAAIVPLAVTDWLASLVATQAAERVSLNGRAQITRQTSRQVLDRLLSAKSLLASVPDRPAPPTGRNPADAPPGLGRVFNQISELHHGVETTWPAQMPANLLTAWQQAHSGLPRSEEELNATVMRLRVDFSLPGQPRVLLGAHREGSLRWIAELDSAYLWGPLEDAGLDAAWWVRTGHGTLIAQQTGEDFPAQPGDAPGNPARDDLAESSSELFLAGEFGSGEWVFTQIAPRPKVSWMGAPMGAWMGLVALATLLAIAALSHWRIRLILQPLSLLTRGTRRLAAGDAGTRVEIHRDDEIGELAEAFNDMAARIELQIDAMAGLAAIDRGILAGAPFEQVARHALQRLRVCYPGSGVAVSWREGESLLQRARLGPGEHGAAGMPLERLELSRDEVRECESWQDDGRIDMATGAAAQPPGAPRWLLAEGLQGVAAALVFPLRQAGRTKALIVLECAAPAGPDELEPAREIRDRLSVALSARTREQELVHRAAHDSLTGLANRYGLHQRLEGLLGDAPQPQRLAVVSLDLDHFKDVNDTLGHEAGDELLCAASQRLQSIAPAGATVARPGGDEFVMLLPGADEATAASLARLAIATLGRPFALRSVEHRLGASAGIAMGPEHGGTREELLRCADIALFVAKAAGRCQHKLFSPDLDHAARERVQLQAELRRALQRNEFVLHFQPRVRPGDGRILSAEALIRWQHPQRGLLYPGAFIAVAEASGQIDEIGRWVLDAACSQAADWRRRGVSLERVSVNLSTRQLGSGGLPMLVREALARHRLPGSALELEVTESLLMGDPGEASVQLAQMREWGVTIALDDFGTGYSSMSILRQLPIDVMKVDRSFVVGLGVDEGAMAVTHAIVALARSLHLHLVAEGIETEAQAEVLRAMGCDEFQGYLYSRPLEPGQFERLPGLGRVATTVLQPSSLQPAFPPAVLPPA
jgi:diguanylate cyclase